MDIVALSEEDRQESLVLFDAVDQKDCRITENVSKDDEHCDLDQNNVGEGSLAFSESDDDTKISLFFNDSDGEENKSAETKEKQSSDCLSETKSIQAKTTKTSEGSSSEDDDFPNLYARVENQNVKSKKKYSIIDSDDSEEEKPPEDHYDFKCSSEDEQNSKANIKSKKVKNSSSPDSSTKKVVRKSAKAALDTINAIKSETQRLHRESKVNIPYHCPKSCTLKEFMARKTVLRPELRTETQKKFALKMTKEELKDYAEFLEKRKDEAEKLFASEINDDDQKDHTETFIDDGNNDDSKIEKPVSSDNEEKIDHQNDSDSFLVQNGAGNNLESDEDILIAKLEEDITPKEVSITLPDSNQNEEEKINTEPKIMIISNVQISPAIRKTDSETVRNLKQVIAEEASITNIRPKLSGSPSSFIDLDTGDIIPSSGKKMSTGLDKLLQRFTNSQGKKNTSVNENILDTSRDHNVEPRPGACFVELKKQLMQKIKEQRKKDISKKLKHQKEEEEIACKIFEEEDDEDYKNEVNQNGKSEADDEEMNMSEEEYSENTHLVHEHFDGEPNELSDKDEDADDESDSNGTPEKNVTKQRNKKIRKPIDDSSSDEEPCDIAPFSLKYPMEITEVENPELASKNVANKSAINVLFDEKNDSICNDTELLELCSGTFERTQKNVEKKLISESQNLNVNESDVCIGTAAGFGKTISQKANALFSADQSSDDEIVSKSKSKVKQKNVIQYSDDEDEFDDRENRDEKLENQNLEKENSDVEEVQGKEAVQTFIDYDSDENEIQVEMTKTDINKKVNEYFENEAELSESEWGSADEDERNLDKYDIELGDEDEFDNEKLKDEIGKIHMRKIMDEDARQLKKMQELLFDDEENDGIGRQRQFRWKKTEMGFNLEEPNTENIAEPLQCDSNDEEDEELWRKMKHEREMLLKERLETTNLSPLKSGLENILDNSKVHRTSFNQKQLNESEKKNDSPFLISKSAIKCIRGSFLKRDCEILTKVASIATNVSDFDGISTVQTITGKQKNFVFSVLSQKPQEESNKRKLSSSSDIKSNHLKKARLSYNEKKHKKNFIDSLDSI